MSYQSLIVYQQAAVIYDLTVLFCFESHLKLTSVSRASCGELLEDYKDFLRQKNLPLWEKTDPRVWQIRQIRLPIGPINQSGDWTNLSNWTNWTNSQERFSNLLITLINKQTYLLDRLLKAIEEKFVKEGGFREKLFKKRLEYRQGRV